MIYALAGAALFGIGLYAVIAGTEILRRILAVNVIGAGVFAIFLAIARRNSTDPADPVPHAMVLTGIVVTVSVTAFAVAVVRRLDHEHRKRR